MDKHLDKLLSQLRGPNPAEKQIILLKLLHLLEHMPEFSGQGSIDAQSPQRQWLSSVGALLKRYDKLHFGTWFDTSMNFMGRYRNHSINKIQGYVVDAIEAIKLELELDGRSDIGTAYAPREMYRYFRDLKQIIAGARQEILVVDPYFNGDAFDAYLSDSAERVSIRILAERYASDIVAYADRHSAQFETAIEIRRSKELHDRLCDNRPRRMLGKWRLDQGRRLEGDVPHTASATNRRSQMPNLCGDLG